MKGWIAAARCELGWKVNDAGAGLMRLSRRIVPYLPDPEHITLDGLLRELDRQGLTLFEVATLAESKHLPSRHE